MKGELWKDSCAEVRVLIGKQDVPETWDDKVCMDGLENPDFLNP